MGTYYNVSLFDPAPFYENVTSLFSEKILDKNEFLQLFKHKNKPMPDYAELDKNANIFSSDIYDSLVLEFLADNTIELFKAGFLFDFAKLNKDISKICVHFGDSNAKEIKINIKFTNPETNLHIYEMDKLKQHKEFIKSVLNINILFDKISEKSNGKKNKLLSKVFGNEVRDLKTLRMKLEDDDFSLTWRDYINGILYSIENNLLFGVYSH